jgi:hypothetical protein
MNGLKTLFAFRRQSLKKLLVLFGQQTAPIFLKIAQQHPIKGLKTGNLGVGTINLPFRGHFLSSDRKNLILANMTHIEPFMNKQFSFFFKVFAPSLSYALSTFVDKSYQRKKKIVVIPVT